MNAVIGLFLAFAIGAVCRWFDIPVPAPPRIVGALLVVAMTVGFTFTGWVIGR
jgi:XapX domain-containing protein